MRNLIDKMVINLFDGICFVSPKEIVYFYFNRIL